MQSAEQHVDFLKPLDFMDTGLNTKTNDASAVIGPKGGVVTVTDPDSTIYGTSLRVPAGALDTPVQITIREGDHACAFGLGPSIKLFPGGLHFKRAATLTVYLNDTGSEDDDFDRSVPACYHYDESRGQWTHNSAVRLERLGDAVVCELNHL